MALESLDSKAILSFLFTVKLRSRNKVFPSKVLLRPLTVRILFPGSRPGVKMIPGYFLVEGFIS